MLPRVREFYGLEKLWEDTPVAAVAVGAEPARAPRKKAAQRPRAAR
jgi:hypothetical protein